MKLHFAIVEFDGGTAGFVAKTEAEVFEKVAKEYVDKWREDLPNDGSKDIELLIKNACFEEAVMEYFNYDWEYKHPDTLFLGDDTLEA